MNTKSFNYALRALLRGALCALTLTICVDASARAASQATPYQAAPAERTSLGRQACAPGSLLIYPEYGSGNLGASISLLTVTNVHPSQSIRVVWAYVRGSTCSEFTTQHLLIPNDTLSVLTPAHNPNPGSGFLKIYATDEALRPVSFNYLTGGAIRLEGTSPASYSVEAAAFRSPRPPGSVTDLNQNGRMDLDGLEYARAAKTLVFPRFIGTDSSSQMSSLILANLSGGAEQEVTVDIQIFNDNGYELNASYSFHCWQRVPLESISPIFTQFYLKNNTPHVPSEPLGFPQLEAGWFQITATHATAPGLFLTNPAILAFLVEGNSTEGSAELPYGIGMTATGSLGTGLSALPPAPGLQRGR